jgi:hypothetical protein
MKIKTISQQMFGDINQKLNLIRAQMNSDTRKKCLEVLEKKKEDGGLLILKNPKSLKRSNRSIKKNVMSVRKK